VGLVSPVVDIEDSAAKLSTVSRTESARAMDFLSTWQLTALLDACEHTQNLMPPKGIAGFESRLLVPLISISIYQSIKRVRPAMAALVHHLMLFLRPHGLLYELPDVL
jgi:hypothetical protein